MLVFTTFFSRGSTDIVASELRLMLHQVARLRKI
jgi:hypothetical protein